MTEQITLLREQRPEGVVVTVTISNARRLNTMNRALMAEFVAKVDRLATDPALRALVITGAGEKAFIGGADIKEMAALRDSDQARAFITQLHACCHAVRRVPVPVIARIQGFTFGAGLELAASCDMRVAADTATFGMPEVRLGIPSVIEAALLPMLVGWGRTRHMLLLGETFGAQQAQDWGLLEQVTTADQLDAAVEAWVAQLLSCAPRAVRLQKALIQAWEDLPLRAAVQAGIDSFASAFETAEPSSAMQQFLARQASRHRE